MNSSLSIAFLFCLLCWHMRPTLQDQDDGNTTTTTEASNVAAQNIGAANRGGDGDGDDDKVRGGGSKGGVDLLGLLGPVSGGKGAGGVLDGLLGGKGGAGLAGLLDRLCRALLKSDGTLEDLLSLIRKVLKLLSKVLGGGKDQLELLERVLKALKADGIPLGNIKVRALCDLNVLVKVLIKMPALNKLSEDYLVKALSALIKLNIGQLQDKDSKVVADVLVKVDIKIKVPAKQAKILARLAIVIKLSSGSCGPKPVDCSIVRCPRGTKCQMAPSPCKCPPCPRGPRCVPIIVKPKPYGAEDRAL